MNSHLVPVNASTSVNAITAAGVGGNHRQKLDQIRSSLRPFEQKWYEEVDEDEDEEGTLDDDDDEEEEEEDKDGKKAEMIRALVEAGYDQESAFYALKLVNFRSVIAAIQVLTSIKKNIVQQHTKNNNNNNNGKPSSGIPLFNLPPLPPNPNKFIALNGATSSAGAWPSEPLSQAKSFPMEQQKSPLTLGRQQFRVVHRTPTMVSPPSPKNIGPSPGHALRQSQSFGPADLLLQQQQTKSSVGTVIRIERNQSERVERKKRVNGEQEANDGLRMMAKGLKTPIGQKANHPNLPSSPPPFMGSPQLVQHIFIDSQQAELELERSVQPPPDYSMFIGQLNQKRTATRLEATPSNSSAGMPTAQSTNFQHNRSVSPLPESVAKRLKAGNYERVVKPCRAPMFRFFMEQHIEKLTQQYHERNKRARQLNHEMEAAGLAENVKENMLRLLRQKESKYLRMKRQKMNKEMFEMIRHIGIGAFGKVTLVRKWDTDQVYAMKTLVKADVIQKQQAAHVKAERDILAEANSPWIVKLFFSFQDAQNLYFIMEYVPGGDMMQLLINMGIFPESLAKFYIAELTLAVEYVHSLGFIHRDIKPDNILIDKGGHIKLTDFGLCTGLRWTHDKRNYVVYEENGTAQGLFHLREDSFSLPPGIDQRVKVLDMRHHRKRDRAHSVVGTGNYMAPEVIQRTGYNQATDWWSVGVILYEMVYGRPPFMSQRDDPAETQYMIVHWGRFLDLNNPMGARLSRPCVDCIAKLCCDQQNRIGQKAGAKDIKGHTWFRGINFANLRQSTPEYIPRVRHPEDTSNFDTFEVRSDEQTQAPAEGNRRTGRIEEKSGGGIASNFIDFTFRHFFSEGMGPQGGGIRNQQPRLQRPSLAPLMETNEGQKAIQQKNKNVAPIHPKKIMQLAPPMERQPNNPEDRSPLSARTILQIGGPIGAKKTEPFRFRPFQAKLDEEEMMEEPEESQC